jgi:hypothetical protein
VELAAHGRHPALDVDHELDHVFEVTFHESAELAAIEAGLQEDDIGLGAFVGHAKWTSIVARVPGPDRLLALRAPETWPGVTVRRHSRDPPGAH